MNLRRPTAEPCVITFNRGATIYQWPLGFKYWCHIWKEPPTFTAHKTGHQLTGTQRRWDISSVTRKKNENATAAAADARRRWMARRCQTGGGSYRTAFASPPVRLRQSACSCSRLTDLYEESQSCHTLHFFFVFWLHRPGSCQQPLLSYRLLPHTLMQPHAAFVCWGARF